MHEPTTEKMCMYLRLIYLGEPIPENSSHFIPEYLSNISRDNNSSEGLKLEGCPSFGGIGNKDMGNFLGDEAQNNAGNFDYFKILNNYQNPPTNSPRNEKKTAEEAQQLMNNIIFKKNRKSRFL